MAYRLLHRGPDMQSRQRGYSLAEMMVVVAIIGVLSLVAVPSFITYQRSARLKTSMRQVTNDLRAARQRAVARNVFVKLSFNKDVNPGTFRIFEATSGVTVTAVNWVQTAPQAAGTSKVLEKPITFENVNFTDVVDGDGNTDGELDVIFQSDGTAVLPGGVTTGELKVKSSDPIPISSYRITVTSVGKITAQ
ncbi:MAG TPA: GspH/FimT family pseudopilin [Thermoanaerobaculia bacterium]|nr:GspH/FimT family pseudopilin [Thermoanaerobaculia bacterium]